MNNNEDRYWNVEEVVPYIIGYLEKKFPESIIIREFDQIDIMVLKGGDDIPVEIQKIYTKRDNPRISVFENDTRKQIEQNISMYRKCYLFIDTKLLDYLNNTNSRNISINMDWLYQFYRSGKATVFAISINGIINEMKDKDFCFITKLSMTCNIGKDENDRILQRNKPYIAFKILKDNRYTTNEINGMYNSFKICGLGGFDKYLTRPDSTEREKQYYGFYNSWCHIYNINNILNCNVAEGGIGPASVLYAISFGIFERNEQGSAANSKYTRIWFVDNYNIAQYFPGYIRNKELWEYVREHPINTKTFYAIIRGEYPNYLKDRKNQKSMFDY